MALFGSNLKAPDPSGMGWADKLNLLGAAFRDAGNPDSAGANVANVQQILLARQQQQRLAQANQALSGLFGGSAPTPDHTQGGAYVPPELRSQGSLPSISDPAVVQKLLAIKQAGGDIGPALEILKANKAPDPQIAQTTDGRFYNQHDAAAANMDPSVDIQVANGFAYNKNDKGNIGSYFPEAPIKGASPYRTPGGGTGWAAAPGAADAIATIKGAEAGAEARAKAPYEFHNASPSDNVWWGGGDGAAQAPGLPGAPPAAATGPVGQRITSAAQAANATPGELGFLHTTAHLESADNANAQNGRSTGVFQFHPETYAAAGGTGDIHDVGSQTTAALNLARQNSQALQQRLGRPPTPAEVYIAHQQGAGGASALLTAPPDVNAIAALQGAGVSPRIARLSILNNGGKEDMTAGQFTDMWRQRYAKAGGGAAAGQPQGGQGGPRLLQVGQPDQDAAPLDDKTVQYLAERYVAAGGGANALPPMGMGKSAAANRDKVLNKAAEIEQSTGATGNDAVLRMHTIKAASGSLNAISKVRSQVEASENTVEKNANFALSLAPKGGGPTGIPLLNTPIQLWRNQVAGSPQVSSFNNAIGTVADEYAKVMTTNTGSGGAGTSDSARKEAYARLSKSATFAQLQSNIAAMQTEMRNRTESLRSKEQELQDTIKNGGVAPKPKAAQVVPTGFKILGVR